MRRDHDLGGLPRRLRPKRILALMQALGRVGYGVHASRAFLNRVVRGVERRVRGGRMPSFGDQEESLHRLLGVTWPCSARAEFEELWASVLGSLHAQGLDVGRGAYGGWDDADRAVGRAVWCLARHLRPEVVVETGVARGLTTYLLLKALERNGSGRLWSIDLAPSAIGAPGLAGQTAAAVPPELRCRWTLLQGTSRRCLPGLLDGLAQLELPVDLFIHDSLHTGRNVRFELDSVWPRLSPDGVALVDDVEQNAAFGSFARRHPEVSAIVCDAADGRSQFGCLLRSSST
jgi:Methyltransferase domain